MAPFDVELVTLGKPGSERALAADGSTTSCESSASTCSTTTATTSPGEKFADAELLGCPLRVTIGKKSVEAREIEVQVRRGQEKRVACRSRAPRRRRRSCGGPSPDVPPAGRARPLRRPAAADAPRPAAQPVDDPERDRLRPPGARPGVPRGRAELRRRRARASRSRCSPSSPGATTSTAWRPASPASTAASGRCSTRSSTGCWWSRRGRLLALRAAAALGAAVLAAREAADARGHAARAAPRHRPQRSMLGRWAVWPVMSALGSRAPVEAGCRRAALRRLAMTLAATVATCKMGCGSCAKPQPLLEEALYSRFPVFPERTALDTFPTSARSPTRS